MEVNMAENKDSGMLKNQIKDVDVKIVELLDERAKLVKEAGDFKKKNNIPAYQPEQEKEVKDLVMSSSKNIFPASGLQQIYTEIISAARSLETALTVGYLGPEATFTEQAVRKHFGSSVDMKPLASVADVFREVENSKLDYGLVPIENSIGGTVYSTLDEFVDSPVHVIGEEYLNIHQNLLANVSSKAEIKRIYSHPQSFQQCRIWLETNLPNVEKIEVASNGKAASMVPWDKYSSAIAASIAAEKYGLNILAENIEDNPENYTRFWVISGKEVQYENPEKTTVLVSVKDKPGALLHLLMPFEDNNINLSKIESRPSRRRPWDYLFFVDMEGGIQKPNIQKALEKVKENAVFLKVLGSYPKGNY
jgi:chorismate mutase / prephenate dehydratase